MQEITKYNDIEVYVTKPADYPHSPSKLLLLLTGGTGIHSTNNQLQADKYAQEGFLVVMPDQYDRRSIIYHAVQLIAMQICRRPSLWCLDDRSARREEPESHRTSKTGRGICGEVLHDRYVACTTHA